MIDKPQTMTVKIVKMMQLKQASSAPFGALLVSLVKPWMNRQTQLHHTTLNTGSH